MSAAESGRSGLSISPQDLIDIVRRRWWVFLLPVVVIFVLALAVVMRLPATYLSSGTILIEGQQIPDSLVKTTVDGDAKERIGVVRRLVMTRENLLGIIDTFNLFPQERTRLSDGELIGRLRSGISIQTLSSPGSKKSKSVAFSVSYESSSPDTAYAVADELVRLFLAENFRTRTERASETTAFLSNEADNLKAELDQIEAGIAEYKQRHADALPEHLKLHMDMLERVQTGLDDLQLEIKSAQDELRFLDVEKAAVTAGMDAEGVAILTPGQELTKAESELRRLQGLYSDKHPDVRRQRAIVASLENKVQQELSEQSSMSEEERQLLESADGNIDVARIEARMKSVRERIDTLEGRAVELEQKQLSLEEIVLRTPEVQRGLAILTRDYENTEKKFKEVTSKAMEARMAQALEEDEQAERFTVIDPPVRPDAPYKPNRKKLLLLAFVAACVIGAGVVFILEMLDRKIRGPRGVERLLGETPLIVIPYVTVETDSDALKVYRQRALLASIGLGISLLVLMHFFFMPMTTVVRRLLGMEG